METFIVRIYDRDANDPEMLIGTVEEQEHGEGEVFTTLGELACFFRSAGGRIRECV